MLEVSVDTMAFAELLGQLEWIIAVLDRDGFVLVGSDFNSDCQNFIIITLEGVCSSSSGEVAKPWFELGRLVSLLL